MGWNSTKVKTYNLGDNQIKGRIVSEDRLLALDAAAPESLRNGGLGDIELLLDIEKINDE